MEYFIKRGYGKLSRTCGLGEAREILESKMIAKFGLSASVYRLHWTWDRREKMEIRIILWQKLFYFEIIDKVCVDLLVC